FPAIGPRRLLPTETIRALVRETSLAASDLVWPLFVVEGTGTRREIASMPGQSHWSVDRLVEAGGEARDAGLAGVILFGLPKHKDAEGSGAWADDGIVQ